MEFKAFPDIPRIDKILMTMTQKIHGTNAQILVFEERKYIGEVPDTTTAEQLAEMYPGKRVELAPWATGTSNVMEVTVDVLAGSRSRWLTVEHDNYGFALFVHTNKEKIIDLLGVGRHDGEWAGPGINSGEGLKEKTFVLFNWWQFPPERPLPPQMMTVPVLYRGPLDTAKIQEVMDDLRTNGSKLVPGFMRPEGAVIELLGHKIKRVFTKEETKWDRPDKEKVTREKVDKVDVSHLLQPIRMEKLLSRDEVYMREFPASLPSLCAAYVADLEKEDQIQGTDDEKAVLKKALGGRVFGFAKAMVLRQQKIQSGEISEG